MELRSHEELATRQLRDVAMAVRRLPASPAKAAAPLYQQPLRRIRRSRQRRIHPSSPRHNFVDLRDPAWPGRKFGNCITRFRRLSRGRLEIQHHRLDAVRPLGAWWRCRPVKTQAIVPVRSRCASGSRTSPGSQSESGAGCGNWSAQGIVDRSVRSPPRC